MHGQLIFFLWINLRMPKCPFQLKRHHIYSQSPHDLAWWLWKCTFQMSYSGDHKWLMTLAAVLWFHHLVGLKPLLGVVKSVWRVLGQVPWDEGLLWQIPHWPGQTFLRTTCPLKDFPTNISLASLFHWDHTCIVRLPSLLLIVTVCKYIKSHFSLVLQI